MIIIEFLNLIDDEDDKALFECIYNKYHKDMFKICNKILQYHSAEDALQESFIYIAKSINRFRNLSDYETRNLLLLIAKSRSLDMYRKLSKLLKTIGIGNSLEYNSDKLTTYNQIPELDGCNEIIESILALKQDYKDILELFFVYEMTRTEISKTLKLSYWTTVKRLNKAKAVLQNELIKRGLFNE